MPRILWIIMGIALAGMIVSCGDDDDNGGPDGSTDTDTDTDVDTDSDTDTDTDTDTDAECEAEVSGVPAWGGACHVVGDCPTNTTCIKVSGMDTTEGFCAPGCCEIDSPDSTYCTDQGAGDERCYLGMMEGSVLVEPFYCSILCDTALDCPDGTDCREISAGINICYGYVDVPDGGTPDAGAEDAGMDAGK